MLVAKRAQKRKEGVALMMISVKEAAILLEATELHARDKIPCKFVCGQYSTHSVEGYGICSHHLLVLGEMRAKENKRDMNNLFFDALADGKRKRKKKRVKTPVYIGRLR